MCVDTMRCEGHCPECSEQPRGSAGNWRQVELGAKNRVAVRRWFETHLCGTQSECASELGLSPMAVNRHVRAIRSEWK